MEVKVEKTNFDIELISIDASAKIKIIKEVRSIFGLGLKEVYLLKNRQKMQLKRYQEF